MLPSVMGWMLIGLLVGVVARQFMARDDPGGYVATSLLGIAGSLFGGLLGTAYLPREPSWAQWVGAIVAASALLALYRTVMRARS